MDTWALLEALKATAATLTDGNPYSLTEGTTYVWTGATAVRTVSAEDLGSDTDRDFLYFQLRTADGSEVFWMEPEFGDVVTLEDMEDYLSS